MRIAMLGPISWRTPPRHYGAWETVVSNLAEGLSQRGHDVTLFATGDSYSRARVNAVCPRSYEEDQTLDPKVWEALHISQVMENAHHFDLIHNNYDFLPLTYSRLIEPPMLTTVHGFSLDQFRLVYRKYRDTHFVSISDADRDPYLQYVATVYNGIRMDQFKFRSETGNHLVFVGRIHPDKGVHLAIDLALQAAKPLIIAGIIQDQEYFDNMIKPRLTGDIEFVGPVGPEDRDCLLGDALASLHLTTIPERFGLAMAESMAAGTPVIGFDRGSVAEVVEDGRTGFVVQTLEQAVMAVDQVRALDRQACRRRAETKFSIDAMTDGYVQVYERIQEMSR